MSEHGKGLWALFWRMFVFVPVGLLGIVALVLLLAFTFLSPVYAVTAFVEGRYLLGVAVIAFWLVWLRFGRRAWPLVLEGLEHGSL